MADVYGLATSGSRSIVHLLVDCARARVVDRRLERLVGEFGLAVAPLWQGASADLVPDGRSRGWWAADELDEYLSARLAAGGLDGVQLPLRPVDVAPRAANALAFPRL